MRQEPTSVYVFAEYRPRAVCGRIISNWHSKILGITVLSFPPILKESKAEVKLSLYHEDI